MAEAGVDMFRRQEIGRRDFEKFRRLIHQTCGISLGETKDALLSSRVAKRMRQLGLSSHSDYFDVVVGDASGAEMQCLIDAVSTNVTSFFRETEHFEILANHLSSLVAAGQPRIHMWSAACSTGEEPYSMAMVASQVVGATAKVRILATDISAGALATAQAGRYPAERVSRIPSQYAAGQLRVGPDGDWHVSAAVRSMVAFSPINLAKPPFPMRGPLDVVFCRNVMIYFDRTTRQHLVREIERLLPPGGLLMLGHAESLAGVECSMKALAPAVYRKTAR